MFKYVLFIIFFSSVSFAQDSMFDEPEAIIQQDGNTYRVHDLFTFGTTTIQVTPTRIDGFNQNHDPFSYNLNNGFYTSPRGIGFGPAIRR